MLERLEWKRQLLAGCRQIHERRYIKTVHYEIIADMQK